MYRISFRHHQDSEQGIRKSDDHSDKRFLEQINKDALYIFPVSLYAATETFDLKKAGRKAHKWTGKELTEEEKKSLERTKKRVRRYASKFNLI